jgi:phosphoribosylamine--glycine ligase
LPTFIDLPYTGSVESQIKTIEHDLSFEKIDLVLTSGFPLTKSKSLRDYVSSRNIPHLFPSADLTVLESNRDIAKNLLKKLDIPHSIGKKILGWELFRDFFKYPLPFVIKIEDKFMHGRQTMIIDDSNIDDMFHKLFSKITRQAVTPYSINFENTIFLEQFINLKYELSYHAVLNCCSWSYLGAARDYKKQYNNDQGEMTNSMGAYSLNEIDQVIHTYMDKIHNYLISINKPYRGFLFLGIGVGVDGVPYVLEINTRAGDPEISTISNSIDNFLDILMKAATDEKIPSCVSNGLTTVTVAVNNQDLDWNTPAKELPIIERVPDDILFGIDGSHKFKTRHSLFSASALTRQDAAVKVYEFLDRQHLGQFYCRSDIGLLD